MSNQIVIRSRDRSSTSTSASKAKFSLPGWNLANCRSIELLYFQAYNVSYTIQQGINDTVTFTENSVSKSCTVTPGQYTASTLATELASDLTTASGGYNTYTCVYSTSTRKLTFAATNAFTLTFTSSSKTPWRECGFTDSSGTQSVNSSTGTACTSLYPVNLSSPLYWIVQIPQLGYVNTDSSDIQYSYIIPITVDQNAVIEYNHKQLWTQIIPIDSSKTPLLKDFDVIIADASNQVQTLNSEWTLVLKKNF
jgi:hypothetical protein